jgi:hypothetical protein
VPLTRDKALEVTLGFKRFFCLLFDSFHT